MSLNIYSARLNFMFTNKRDILYDLIIFYVKTYIRNMPQH